MRLATYEAASSPQGLFEEVVAVLAQGLPLRGVERAKSKALSKSTASWMWAQKSREQLELLRKRPLTDVDWLALVIDGSGSRANCAWWWPWESTWKATSGFWILSRAYRRM